jgi:GT2 family glycosyltransferase
VGLAIVVVTFDSAEVLGDCLDAVGERRPADIVVVDNGSSDDSVVVARSRGVRVVLNAENLGFARAANAGAAAATAPLLCFLNPDCLPGADLFARATAALAGRPLLCAVPDLLEPGGARVAGRQPGYTPLKLIVDVLETAYGATALSRRLRRRHDLHDRGWWWPHGACLFTHRETFLALGGFDPRFFVYMEDVDFGLRLARAGGEVVALDAVVRHGQGRGARVAPRERRRLLQTSRIAYGRRHHGRALAMVLAALAAPGEPLRSLAGRSR